MATKQYQLLISGIRPICSPQLPVQTSLAIERPSVHHYGSTARLGCLTLPHPTAHPETPTTIKNFFPSRQPGGALRVHLDDMHWQVMSAVVKYAFA